MDIGQRKKILILIILPEIAGFGKDFKIRFITHGDLVGAERELHNRAGLDIEDHVFPLVLALKENIVIVSGLFSQAGMDAERACFDAGRRGF